MFYLKSMFIFDPKDDNEAYPSIHKIYIPTMATSSCEGEYKVTSSATMAQEPNLSFKQVSPTHIFINSNHTLAITWNHASIVHAKHIELHYHYV